MATVPVTARIAFVGLLLSAAKGAIIESVPCEPDHLQAVYFVQDYGELTSGNIDCGAEADPESCGGRGGCCRFGEMFVCDTENLWPHWPCVCGRNTQPTLSSSTTSTSSDNKLDRDGEDDDDDLEEREKRHILELPMDHFNTEEPIKTWESPYFMRTKYWGGPGYPIFIKIGGEDNPKTRVDTNFIGETLAKKLDALVVQTEHRFYGPAFPLEGSGSDDEKDRLASNQELKDYLHVDQAMEDVIQIIKHLQKELGCSTSRLSESYCPIITVAASYPGSLAAMMRFIYPDVVDMAYASSSLIKLYSREEQRQYLYFDHVTKVAEDASPGCVGAYKTTLPVLLEELSSMPIQEAAETLGMCYNKIPKYLLEGGPHLFAKELLLYIAISFAHFNMHYYPPDDPTTDLIKACEAFQQEDKTSMEKLADLMVIKAYSEGQRIDSDRCYDLQSSLPSGPNATLSVADWTGSMKGYSGQAWEFLACTDFAVPTGFGPDSMFLPRSFEMGWLRAHCEARFHVHPNPDRMENKWHFTGEEMVERGGSYILFTNGINDAWSHFSYLEDLSDTIVSVNFPNGTHHSEFSLHDYDEEFPDMIEGREEVASILEEWINVVKQKAQVGVE